MKSPKKGAHKRQQAIETQDIFVEITIALKLPYDAVHNGKEGDSSGVSTDKVIDHCDLPVHGLGKMCKESAFIQYGGDKGLRGDFVEGMVLPDKTMRSYRSAAPISLTIDLTERE